MSRTEVLDGGVDGVAATKEEADEPGADEAAASRHADEAAAAVSVRCHRDRSRRQGSSGRCVPSAALLRVSARHTMANRRGQGPSARLARGEVDGSL